LDAQFLAQGNEPWVVAVFKNKRCYHQLSQTGIVGGVSIFEPAEHFIWFFAKSVDNGNLVGAVGRVFGGKILESSISRGAIGLRLLNQGERVFAPKTIWLELGLLQTRCRILLQDIKRGQVSMKARRVRLDF
jgi:hypothetical protein